jgi:hypothetical protein
MMYYSITNQKLSRACGLMQETLRQLMEGSLISEKEAIAAMKGDTKQ